MLMKWLMEKPENVLVVFSSQEKQRLIKQYAKEELEVNAPLPQWVDRVYTPFELEQHRGQFSGKEVIAIDNADVVLSHFLRRPISIISLTGEAEILGVEDAVKEAPQETDNNQPQQ